MRSIDVFSFYTLGQELEGIKRLPAEPTVIEILIIDIRVSEHVTALLNGDLVEIGVTRGVVEQIRDWFSNIRQRYCSADGQFKWPEPEQKISNWERNKLGELLQKFENVLQAETKVSAVYHVTKKSIFNTQDLVEHSDRSFPGELQPCIPAKSLSEYQSAGRALAFDLATAAAFHVSRAVEAMLRDYRGCFLVGKPGATMGAIVKVLRKHAESSPVLCPDVRTLRQLEQFTNLDRNRIMHPEDVLSVDQAIICFYNGISVITAMAGEVKRLKGSPEQGLLLASNANDAVTNVAASSV